MPEKKLQVALYWGAACGGCDVAVLDTNEFLIGVGFLIDIRLWPIAADGKYRDVEAMADGELDCTLFNGAIRNSENEHVAKLLRRKSKVLVAVGSCAHLGGIPGLANQCTKQEILERVYLDNPSIEAGNRVVPLPSTRVEAGDLEIPRFYRRVYKLDEIVPVDYYLPGCPPPAPRIRAVVEASKDGRALSKVIFETALLTDDEKVRACELSMKAGADYVKTSTGFASGGATAEDIALMARTVAPKKLGVKASGGIRTYDDAVRMIAAGATRIGASASVKIVDEAKARAPQKG